jgi:hypothetical protein
MKKPRVIKNPPPNTQKLTSLEQEHHEITAQLNELYSEIDSSLPSELEALSDEILRVNFERY